MNIKHIKIESIPQNEGKLLHISCKHCNDPKAPVGSICVYFDNTKEVYINSHQIFKLSDDPSSIESELIDLGNCPVCYTAIIDSVFLTDLYRIISTDPETDLTEFLEQKAIPLLPSDPVEVVKETFKTKVNKKLSEKDIQYQQAVKQLKDKLNKTASTVKKASGAVIAFARETMKNM